MPGCRRTANPFPVLTLSLNSQIPSSQLCRRRWTLRKRNSTLHGLANPFSRSLIHRHHHGATKTKVVGQSDFGIFHLALASLTTKLPHHLGTLGQASGAKR